MILKKTVGQALLTIILFTLSMHAAISNNRVRNSFWTEIYLLGPIAKKWSWQMELHYRRMADANTAVNGSTYNIFKNPYQHLYRPFIHYQPNANWRFSLSPLTYGVSFSAPAETKVRTFQPDMRITLQAMYIHNYFTRLTIHHRFRYEYRFLGKTVNHESRSEFNYLEENDFSYYSNEVTYGNIAMHKHRARYMLRAILPLGKHTVIEQNTFYIIGWNEGYFNFGQHVSAKETFDQNRFFLLLGYKLKSSIPIRIELGYGSRTVQRFSVQKDFTLKRSLEQNNIAQLYFWFDNLNLLFKRKKEQL